MSLASKALSVFQRDVFLFLTNLATGVVVARMLGPEALGLWVILQLVPSYAEALARLKFDVAAVYVIGKDKRRPEDVLLGINLMALGSSVLIMAAIWWRADWLTGVLFGDAAQDLRTELLFLLVQIPLQFLYLNYAYLHIAAEEIAIYNRMVLIRALTNSAIAIGMLMFTDSGLWAVLLASVGSFVAGLLYGWAALDRRTFRKPKIDAPLMLALARYGWHLYAAGLLAQLSVYGVRTIIVFFLAPVQVAYYGLAQGAGLLMDRLPQALGTVMFPRISRSGRAESAKLAANAFRIATIFLAAGGIALAVLADALITLLYGEAYSPVARALRIMLPGIVIAGAASTLVNYFQGCGRADLVPKIQLAPLLVQLIAALVLTHRWGLDGAALALSLGLSSTGILQILVFLRIADTRARDLMPRGIDVRQIRDLLGRSVVMRSFARKGQSRPANRERS